MSREGGQLSTGSTSQTSASDSAHLVVAIRVPVGSNTAAVGPFAWMVLTTSPRSQSQILTPRIFGIESSLRLA